MVARSQGAAWLVHAKQYEVKAVGAGCPTSDPCAYVPWETGTLRLVDAQGMTAFAELSVAPGALASWSAEAVLMQANGECYELVRNQPQMHLLGRIAGTIGLAVDRNGVAYCAEGNRLWRHLPRWPFSLALAPEAGKPGGYQLTLTGPTNLLIRIESSPDLRNWTELCQFVSTGHDGVSVGLEGAGLCYRAVWAP